MNDLLYDWDVEIEFMPSSLFQDYWSRFCNKSHKERAKYFTSLSVEEQKSLVHSFFAEGWLEVFIHNTVEDHLEFIRHTYNIDLLDVRIKALRGRTFVIEKKVWDHIREIVQPYAGYYNLNVLFGGLAVRPYGKNQQFYCIQGENYGKKRPDSSGRISEGDSTGDS